MESPEGRWYWSFPTPGKENADMGHPDTLNRNVPLRQLGHVAKGRWATLMGRSRECRPAAERYPSSGRASWGADMCLLTWRKGTAPYSPSCASSQVGGWHAAHSYLRKSLGNSGTLLCVCKSVVWGACSHVYGGGLLCAEISRVTAIPTCNTEQKVLTVNCSAKISQGNNQRAGHPL